jgi:LysR family nitrogen assimilation transcriptional regulator
VNAKQLRYFIAVATEGTFTKASSKLRVAQPALSRQIALLEEELRTPLLVRHRRGVATTEAGNALLERARALVVSLDRIQSEITDYAAAPTGTLRIGCTPTLTSQLVVGPVRNILQAFPRVAIHIHEGVSHQLCRGVVADEIDAAIVSENLAESFLTAEALFDEQVWLFGPRNRRKSADKTSIARIASLPMIMASAPQTTRRFVDRAAARRGLKLNVIAESDSIQATRELLIAGVGYTLAPYSALIGDVESGLMSGTPVREFWIRRSLVRRNDRPINRALQEFKGLVGNQVRLLGRKLPGIKILVKQSAS